MPRAKSKAPKGWEGHRDLSPEGRAFTASMPCLHLTITCVLSGVQVVAYVDWLDRHGRLQRIEVAKARFRPPEVTPRLVVDWGQRALRRWLEDTMEHPEGSHPLEPSGCSEQG